MKYFTQKLLISIALASSFITGYFTPIQAQILETGQINNKEETRINGISGGTDNHQGCGYLNATANQVIKLEDDPNFMSLSVTVDNPEASPTLFVIGSQSNTQFCAFQDQTTGESPSISGLWAKDTYSIYVGDRNGGNYNFTLTINSSNNLIQ